MELLDIVYLVGAGLTGGFIAGLIGVGGGVIFAPVLYFYFESIGVASDVIAPLTLGSSLLCTLVAAASSAWSQFRRTSIHFPVAISVGLCSAVFILLVTNFVTTQPWYDGRAFQVVFSTVLLFVVARMLWPTKPHAVGTVDLPIKAYWPYFLGIGGVSGSVAAAAGIGGGVIMVPAYYHVLKLPMRLSVGTSSASIVIISAAGVASYMAVGFHETVPAMGVGYVDFVRSLLLAVPAVVTAQFGVAAAHRVNTRHLRTAFAAFACIVAIRLIIRALY